MASEGIDACSEVPVVVAVVVSADARLADALPALSEAAPLVTSLHPKENVISTRSTKL